MWPSVLVSMLDSQSGRLSLVRFLLWPLAGFVLNCPEFKSSATLVNSQLVQPPASWGFNPAMFYLHHLLQNYLSGMPAN